MNWLDGLDKKTPAFKIASSNNSRIRVMAGPGTGKSFAMKRRVARLLEEDVEPSTILPVTFTRVAAEDLHRELVNMDILRCEDLKGVTLHSLALQMLMRSNVLRATSRVPRPLNKFEIEPLIYDLNKHGGKRKVSELIRDYEAAWARLQHQQPGYAQDPADAAFEKDIVGWMKFHKSMLIGEVIPQLHQYLQLNPRASERKEYTHILVDEYQDLNRAEQGVIELLSGVANVCIVGDDDQSIYSFKHAHPDGIRKWTTIHSGADDLDLEICRRCPTKVVNMANNLIRHNYESQSVPPRLTPMSENGKGDMRIFEYRTTTEEVKGVSSIISDMIANGIPPGDILILTQSNKAFGIPLYEALIAKDIPIKSYYAESELIHENAQRAFALLKLFVNREDRVALRWLVGMGGRNWNSAGYSRIREHCEKNSMSPWETMTQIKQGLLKLPYTDRIIESFRKVVEKLDALETLPDLQSVVDDLFPDEQDSTRDMRELALKILDQMTTDDRTNFIREFSTSINQPEIPTEIAHVRIMSLHKSKGLSAPVTVIAGCVQGLLPRPPDEALSNIEKTQHMKEQRRLFYVGITRVKADPRKRKPGILILTYSKQMPVATAYSAGISPIKKQYDQMTLYASQFIEELGPEAPRPVVG